MKNSKRVIAGAMALLSAVSALHAVAHQAAIQAALMLIR